MKLRWQNNPWLTREFQYPDGIHSHAVLGITGIFNDELTQHSPLVLDIAAPEATDKPLYEVIGGYYVYLSERPGKDGGKSGWAVCEITIPPNSEKDAAAFQARMIDLARPVIESTVRGDLDPSHLPKPLTLEGIGALARASIASNTFYLGGVSHVVAFDGSAAFGVLHTPRGYSQLEHNPSMQSYSMQFMAASIVTQAQTVGLK